MVVGSLLSQGCPILTLPLRSWEQPWQNMNGFLQQEHPSDDTTISFASHCHTCFALLTFVEQRMPQLRAVGSVSRCSRRLQHQMAAPQPKQLKDGAVRIDEPSMSKYLSNCVFDFELVVLSPWSKREGKAKSMFGVPVRVFDTILPTKVLRFAGHRRKHKVKPMVGARF